MGLLGVCGWGGEGWLLPDQKSLAPPLSTPTPQVHENTPEPTPRLGTLDSWPWEDSAVHPDQVHGVLVAPSAARALFPSSDPGPPMRDQQAATTKSAPAKLSQAEGASVHDWVRNQVGGFCGGGMGGGGSECV